jgi:peptide/nickel transport system substrate-binding protein
MFRRKAVTAATALAVAALTLAGCSGGGENSSGGDGGGTLTLGSINAPLTLDPAGAEWGNRSGFYQATFDTLTRVMPNGDIDPWLATEWSYNDENTELTMKLRDDVTFTDGSSLTAQVVADNLTRFRDGTGPSARFLSDLESVETPDEQTVVLKLTAPDPALLLNLGREAGLIASGESLSSPDIDTDPVGSGPYVLDTGETISGTSYVYDKNEDYWNPDVQYYDELVINVYTDQTAAINAIKAGEVNGAKLVGNLTRSEVEAIGWDPVSIELGFYSLILADRAGQMNEALGNVDVRRALNYAFDRDALLKATQDGHGSVTAQPFPENSAAYDPELDELYTYDPEAAKQMLADAGYPGGFTLELPSWPAHGQTVYTLVQQQLADVGVTVNLTDAGDNFIPDILGAKYPAAYQSLEQNVDWHLIQNMISPDAPWNPFHYQDPKVDELITTIQNGDEDTQEVAAKELNAYLVDQAWFVPLFRSDSVFAADPNTQVDMIRNAFPAIYDIKPKG